MALPWPSSTAIRAAVVVGDRGRSVSRSARRVLSREIAPSSHNLCTVDVLAFTEASGAGLVKKNRPQLVFPLEPKRRFIVELFHLVVGFSA